MDTAYSLLKPAANLEQLPKSLTVNRLRQKFQGSNTAVLFMCYFCKECSRPNPANIIAGLLMQLADTQGNDLKALY